MVTRVILFLCDRNTVRSPMAASLLGHAESAGLEADDAVDPFAIAVMREEGIDIAGHAPVQIDPAAIRPGTLVIALSLPAFEAARKWRETRPFELDYWALPAVPSPDHGREGILDGFRSIREALKLHIRNRFANP